jgi:hypothetical protein
VEAVDAVRPETTGGGTTGAELTGVPREAGLTMIGRPECSSSRHGMATAVLRCYRGDSSQIPGQIGAQATAGLITVHQMWSDWLGSGRMCKFAVAAEQP